MRLVVCAALFAVGVAGCSSSQTVAPVVVPKAALAVTVSTLEAGTTVRIVLANVSNAPVQTPSAMLASWLSAVARNQQLSYAGAIAPGAKQLLSFELPNNAATRQALFTNYQYVLSNALSKTISIASPSLTHTLLPKLDVNVEPTATYKTLLRDVLVNADMWDIKPEIMSAGYGFQGIEGVGNITELNPTRDAVIAAGGAWETITTPNPPPAAYTTAASPAGVAFGFGYPTYLADAMPVCFSWPVQPSTVSPKNFALKLNTGAVVTPYVASITPNNEYNERACVVIFGTFGNRIAPGYPGGIYPVRVTIVPGDAPLKLVGPNGPVSAVGLSKESTNPYVHDGGPTMNAAKISVMSTAGEGAPKPFDGGSPNDCDALYGSGIQYRLRTFSTGGTSPDGVAAILPNQFSKFFQIQVTDKQGNVHWITQAGVPYTFAQGTIEVIGLADLGKAGTPLNDAYVTDRDNQIDICLEGDRAAMRLITAVNIPASGAYSRLYNPGGPGNDPTPGVTYTQPGKSQLVPVIQAIDNPMTVTFHGKT
jgi:hypothetical protein